MLQILHLNNNDLQSIPHEICQLKSLQYLSVDKDTIIPEIINKNIIRY